MGERGEGGGGGEGINLHRARVANSCVSGRQAFTWNCAETFARNRMWKKRDPSTEEPTQGCCSHVSLFGRHQRRADGISAVWGNDACIPQQHLSTYTHTEREKPMSLTHGKERDREMTNRFLLPLSILLLPPPPPPPPLPRKGEENVVVGILPPFLKRPTILILRPFPF